MPGKDLLQDFVHLEEEQARCSAIGHLAESVGPLSPNTAVGLCRLLHLIPSKNERTRLASALRLPAIPDVRWAILGNLLLDPEQDVVANSVNALTFSGTRALGHRVLGLYRQTERSQRVLYCAARYAEEAFDRRIAPEISSALSHEMSDAFLSRSLNALHRLGVCDEHARAFARELLLAQQDAVNLDRKSAVSAVLYLAFAGTREDIATLASIHANIKTTELRRVAAWALRDFASLQEQKFGARAALAFLQRERGNPEPSFAGRGCFSDEALQEGTRLFLASASQNSLDVATTILALGHLPSIEILASHPVLGISAVSQRSQPEEIALWRKFWPYGSVTFSNEIRNPSNFHAWHENNGELLLATAQEADFTAAGKSGWNALYTKFLESNLENAATLAAAQLMALERAWLATGGADTAAKGRLLKAQERIVANVLLLAGRCEKTPLQQRREVENRVFGTTLGSRLPAEARHAILDAFPIPEDSWVYVCAAGEQNLSNPGAQALATRLIQSIRPPNPQSPWSLDEYLFYTTSRMLALVSLALPTGRPRAAEQLATLKSSSEAIQAFFAVLQQSEQDGSPGEEHAQSEDEEVADWSGHVAHDHPILRWNAVAQVLLHQGTMCQKLIDDYERLLIEALRVAPHVEKRWVIRALARLGTDDAIKAILYQALQHVDSEFVALAIRELIPSKHPRAQQALIRCVGRNTISDDLKLLILEDLPVESPDSLLHELRALELMKLSPDIEEAVRDAAGRIAALIETPPHETATAQLQVLARVIDIDTTIKGRIPRAERLSVDTVSALRTAEMILAQSQSWGTDAVDLSPIVNMHTKAVELAMREIFEPYTNAVLRKGILSRKLDVLGYARPVPEKMQVFEDYLAALPVIKSIPYFSKFKLRKILRAICLYRPGKRFTLDGPKAFALFFLVASRRQCPFGLAHILDIGFETDLATFEYIKTVHSLQDSRNRAVHEGLTWEAHDDIESMRGQAYDIINKTLTCGEFLSTTGLAQLLEAGS